MGVNDVVSHPSLRGASKGLAGAVFAQIARFPKSVKYKGLRGVLVVSFQLYVQEREKKREFRV
jgi:hypothetical protein